VYDEGARENEDKIVQILSSFSLGGRENESRF